MKKKKEFSMPKLETALAKKKVIYYWWVAVIISVIGLFSLALWARGESKDSTKECVQKNVVNQYVCKIVGAEPDENVVAVECLTK